MHPFFFRKLQLYLLYSQFYFQFAIFLRAEAQRFTIFDYASFLLNFMFLLNKMHELFHFKAS